MYDERWHSSEFFGKLGTAAIVLVSLVGIGYIANGCRQHKPQEAKIEGRIITYYHVNEDIAVSKVDGKPIVTLSEGDLEKIVKKEEKK